MSDTAPEKSSLNGGRVAAPADDPGVLAAAVIGAAVADVHKAVASRVGIDPDRPWSEVLARLDQVLADRPEPPPKGAELVDGEALAELRADAEAGRNARRNSLLASAIREGKISPAQRRHFETLMDADPIGTERTLASIPRNTIPIMPVGYGTEDQDDEQNRLLREVFGV